MVPEQGLDEAKLAQFLGKRAHRIVTSIRDGAVRARVLAGISACAGALRVIDAVDLSPHELADLETPNVAVWSALAPEIRDVLLAVRRASDLLVELFPALSPSQDIDAADLEHAFAMMAAADSSDGIRQADAARRRREQNLDQLVKTSASERAEEVAESVRALATVLQSDITHFGTKLRNPAVVGDRWFLLGELHDFLSQCTNCLEAIVATILGAHTTEDLEHVLPRYLDANTRAVKLRSAMVDLSVDLERFNQAARGASREQLSLLRREIISRLAVLSGSTAYKFLRPQDKRAVILFRIFATGWDEARGDVTAFCHELEDFSKFLALMCDLSWRDALADADRRALEEARMILESGVDVPMVKPYLERIYGRSPAIDVHIRALREGQDPPRQALITALTRAGQQLGLG